MTEADRFQRGQEVSKVFGSRVHMALRMSEGQVTKPGKLIAVNRGATFNVISSETEALSRLRG